MMSSEESVDEGALNRKIASVVIMYGAFAFMIIYSIALFRNSTNWRTESKCLYYTSIVTAISFYLSLIITKFIISDGGSTGKFVASTIWISVSLPIY